MFLAQPYNPGPTAQLYSSLAAVLAGFAFAGLILYLSRPPENEVQPKPPARGKESDEIGPGPIVTTLFCAMSSLTICAFLYGRAAGESEPSGRIFLMLSLYGVVLAPAVLSLFYALNLIMASQTATARAAIDTRWVVAAVGPAVVICLLADLLANAWAYGCDKACPAWTSPRLWGFVIAAIFLVFGLLTSLLAARVAVAEAKKKNAESTPESVETEVELGPVGSMVCGFLSIWPIARSTRFFRQWKSSPAFITLVLTAAVAMFSLWARGTSDSFGTRAWPHVVLGFAALVLGIFAFAAASVMDKPIFHRAETLKKAAEERREREAANARDQKAAATAAESESSTIEVVDNQVGG